MFSLLLLLGPPAYTLQASYVPPDKPGAGGFVSVAFSSTDPDLRLDEYPAPRLKLDPLQGVLLDRQAASSSAPVGDASKPRYLDTRLPIGFPVAVSKEAGRGTHVVKGSVTYFYCSLKQGWCRKGSAEVAVNVEVR